MKTFVDRALVYGRMIKFSHSVFALPFALASAAVAANGRVPWRELPWIVVAMIGARSAAMGFNRLADQAIAAQLDASVSSGKVDPLRRCVGRGQRYQSGKHAYERFHHNLPPNGASASLCGHGRNPQSCRQRNVEVNFLP